MQDIIERIKYIRKEMKLSQEEFAKILNMKRNSITQIETNRRNPSERTILDVCEKLNVNEIWLRTGEGDPFASISKQELVAGIVGKAIGSENITAQSAFIALGELSESEWEIIKKVVLRTAELLKEDM